MRCAIVSNVFLKDKYLLCELAVPQSFAAVVPGQFLHVRVADSCDPLLRRPLSIHDVTPGRKKDSLQVRILYEIVGKGTALLSEKKSLSHVEVLGPCGRGFDLEKIMPYEKVYIVAGGMGVAPLFFLAKKIIEVRGQKSEVRKPVVLIGGRTKEHILREREFKDLGCDVHIATEDGSKGHHGRVTDLLKELLAASCAPQVIEKKDLKLKASGKEPVATICACGPKPMLAAIADIARVKEISAQVSLEEFMGCGLGACLGCVISTTSGYKRICHDGPVFDAGEVIWKE